MKKAYLGISILVILALLLGLRAALPVYIGHRVNRPAPDSARYQWHVEDVDIHLLTRSYTLEGLTLRKEGVPEPVFTAEKVRAVYRFHDLFKEPATVDLEAIQPTLNLRLGASQRAPSAHPPDWGKILRKLTLRRVSGFAIRDGEIRFLDPGPSPDVRLHARHVDIRARSLYRGGEDSTRRAGLEAEGLFMGSGRFTLNTRLDPEASRPAFELDFSIRNLDLKTINPALTAYAAMEVESGRLDLETHATASGGAYRGRIRSSLRDFRMAESPKKHPGLLKAVARKVTGVLGEVLEKKTDLNEARGKPPPKADFSGTFPEEVVDAWSMSEFMLKEAFRQGLKP